MFPGEKTYPLLSAFLRDLIQTPQSAASFSDYLISGVDEICRKKNAIDLLPLHSHAIFRDDPAAALPIAAAWMALRYAAKSFDDAEDENSAVAYTTNRGTAFLVLANQALLRLDQNAKGANAILCRFQEACLSACAGQQADLLAQNGASAALDPDAWLAIAFRKSGDLLAWAAWAGALWGGADEPTANCLWEFGRSLGALLQVLDDQHEAWGKAIISDPRKLNVCLPFIYAFYAASPIEKQHLQELLDLNGHFADPQAWKQIQAELTYVGAKQFCAAAALDLRQKALQSLKNTGLPQDRYTSLLNLLDHLCPPIPHQP
jgi:geranylgeranyl pyrophosphate synthase